MGNSNSSRKRSNSNYIHPSIYSPTLLTRSRSKSLLVESDNSIHQVSTTQNKKPSKKLNSSNNFENTNEKNDLALPHIDLNSGSSPASTDVNITDNDSVTKPIDSHLTKQLMAISKDINQSEIDWSFQHLKDEDINLDLDLNHIIKIDLSQNELSSIPKWILNCSNSLKVLNLYQNSIKSIQESDILKYKILEKLIISQNQFEIQPESIDIFNSLYSLKQIFLSSNMIKIFPDLSNLSQLEKIAIDRNQIESLEVESQEDINYLIPKKLKYLSISLNRLKSIPNYILLNDIELEELDLSNNLLESITSKISILAHLKVVNLSNNKLESLPDELFQLGHLERLELQFNRLTTLSQTLENLKNLKFLNLSNNELASLPAEINQLKHLSILYVDNNHIQKLPFQPDTLLNTSLSEIYFNSNEIKSLDPIISLLGLTKISMNFNKISVIPDLISNLIHLTKIELNENEVTKVPSSILQLKSLYDIGLNNNRIEKLPIEICKMTWLQDLSLAKNPIIEKIPRQLLRKGLSGVKEYLNNH